MEELYTLIQRRADMPAGADFALVMDTELMEPLIKKGERVYVSRRESPEEFEVGLFYYMGQVYCRQFCEDMLGTLHLLCANPLSESENIAVPAAMRDKCLCLGKVLLKKKPPMPLYI